MLYSNRIPYLLMFLSAASALFFFIACKKIDKLTQFELKYETEATVPASSAIALPFDLLPMEVSSNSSQTFEKQKTNADLVEEINMSLCKLQIKTPPGGDFSFLKEVHVYLSAPGMSETEIAWATDIPDTIGSELILERSGANLKDYLVKDKFSLRVKVTVDKTTNENYDIIIYHNWLVNAKILGV